MYPTRYRQPDRQHLAHHVLNRLVDRAYFSADQVARAIYHGAEKLHPQKKKRVELLLQKYVQVGILERLDGIVKCPLYRHTGADWNALDPQTVLEFEEQASRRWSRQYEIYLALIDQRLDWLIPRQVDPACFAKTGSLLLRPRSELPRDGLGRPVVDGPPARWRTSASGSGPPSWRTRARAIIGNTETGLNAKLAVESNLTSLTRPAPNCAAPWQSIPALRCSRLVDRYQHLHNAARNFCFSTPVPDGMGRYLFLSIGGWAGASSAIITSTFIEAHSLCLGRLAGK